MIEWAMTSSVLILVVLALRCVLMGRISLRLQYGLWALVLVRLLLPISLGGTSVSVLNTMERTQAQMPNPVVGYLGGGTPQRPVVEPDASLHVEDQQEHNQQDPDQQQAEMDPAGAETGRPIALGTVLLGIWAVGAVLLAVWLLWVNVQFAGKLRRSRSPLAEDCPLPVYVTGAAQTPCLFGLFHPCIYVTEEVAADKTVLRHSLAHELTHFRHGDHIWAALRGLCLALHWYNPLVWLAAILSRRDGELCCDEATVKKLGEGERAAYGRTLLAVTCQGRTNPMLTATSMTGSGSGVKERILLLAKRPKTAVYTLVAVALISALAVGCTFTGAQKGDRESSGVSTGDEFVPDKVAMVQLFSSAWPPDPVTDPDTVTHLWDLYQDFTFEGTADDLTQNNLWSISVTFSTEGTDQEESFTIYQGGLCTLGEDYETIYRLKNGDALYQEFYTVFQRQAEGGTGVDEPNREITLTGLAVEASGSEEEIGRRWAETYAAQYRSLSPDNPLYSTDSAVLECTPYAQSLLSQPREQIYLMRFACHAVDKAGFEQPAQPAR